MNNNKFHRLVFLILFTLSSNFLNGQNGFGNGFLINTNNDTISCLVEVLPSYDQEFRIKNSKKGKSIKTNPDDIVFLNNGYSIFRSITFKDNGVSKRKLLKEIISGRIKVYIDLQFPNRNPYGRNSTYSLDSLVKNFVLSKDGFSSTVNKKTFKEDIEPFIKDIPKILSQIGSKGHKYENLLKLVEKYNIHKKEYSS